MNFVGIDKMSLLDYEEQVSCVLFCKPCNFRCPFCHNGLTVLTSDEEMSFDYILSYLKKRIGIIDAVVFTGGEVTLMDDLLEKINKVRELGFKIKVDTNGTNPELIKLLINKGLVDYFAMDVKNCEEKYPLTTGTNVNFFNKVKETFDLLMKSGAKFEIRTTIVEEFHSIEDMEKIGEAFKDAPKYYLQKFVERGGCIKKGLHSVNEDLANKFKEVLIKYIPNTILRGY